MEGCYATRGNLAVVQLQNQRREKRNQFHGSSVTAVPLVLQFILSCFLHTSKGIPRARPLPPARGAMIPLSKILDRSFW